VRNQSEVSDHREEVRLQNREITLKSRKKQEKYRDRI
jgi:hypothetical protein